MLSKESIRVALESEFNNIDSKAKRVAGYSDKDTKVSKDAPLTKNKSVDELPSNKELNDKEFSFKEFVEQLLTEDNVLLHNTNPQAEQKAQDLLQSIERLVNSNGTEYHTHVENFIKEWKKLVSKNASEADKVVYNTLIKTDEWKQLESLIINDSNPIPWFFNGNTDETTIKKVNYLLERIQIEDPDLWNNIERSNRYLAWKTFIERKGLYSRSHQPKDILRKRLETHLLKIIAQKIPSLTILSSIWNSTNNKDIEEVVKLTSAPSYQSWLGKNTAGSVNIGVSRTKNAKNTTGAARVFAAKNNSAEIINTSIRGLFNPETKDLETDLDPIFLFSGWNDPEGNVFCKFKFSSYRTNASDEENEPSLYNQTYYASTTKDKYKIAYNEKIYESFSEEQLQDILTQNGATKGEAINLVKHAIISHSHLPGLRPYTKEELQKVWSSGENKEFIANYKEKHESEVEDIYKKVELLKNVTFSSNVDEQGILTVPEAWVLKSPKGYYSYGTNTHLVTNSEEATKFSEEDCDTLLQLVINEKTDREDSANKKHKEDNDNYPEEWVKEYSQDVFTFDEHTPIGKWNVLPKEWSKELYSTPNYGKTPKQKFDKLSISSRQQTEFDLKLAQDYAAVLTLRTNYKSLLKIKQAALENEIEKKQNNFEIEKDSIFRDERLNQNDKINLFKKLITDFKNNSDTFKNYSNISDLTQEISYLKNGKNNKYLTNPGTIPSSTVLFTKKKEGKLTSIQEMLLNQLRDDYQELEKVNKKILSFKNDLKLTSKNQKESFSNYVEKLLTELTEYPSYEGISTSEKEDIIYDKLKDKYKTVKRQYKDEDRYPWECDFYIPSEDMFIEYDEHWTHHYQPYNPDDPEHAAEVKKLKKKNNEFYDRVVDIWTRLDPEKRQTAKDNDLNYKVFYSIEEFDNWFYDLGRTLEPKPFEYYDAKNSGWYPWVKGGKNKRDKENEKTKD